MAKLEISVDKTSLERTLTNLERETENAVSHGAGEVMDSAIEVGKKHITDEEAMWRREVLGQTMHADFDYTELSKAEKYVIWNSAMHAGIVDEGAEFTSMPNITNLIPWVLDNLQDWHPFEDDETDTVDFEEGGGLDNIAESIGTTTTSQDGSDSPVHGENLIKDSQPYDSSVFGVYTNGKQSNETPFSYEISGLVDYSDTTTITTNHASYEHLGWSSSQQDTFVNELKSKYGDEDVQFILDQLNKWKKDTYSEEAQWFEKLVKENYDVDADLRFVEEFDSPDPNQSQLDAYHEMGIASQEFMRRHFADNSGKVSVHRGLRDPQVPALASRVFSNPSQNKWSFEDSVVQNYTLSESVADFFSQGVEVEATIDVDEHMVLAPDFVLRDHIDSDQKEAEVNVVGGLRNFGRDELEFSGVPVDDILTKKVTLFSDTEHDALHTLVTSMYDDESLVTDPEMSDRLSDWATEYKSEIGDDSEINAKVDAITSDVIPSTDDSTLTWANANGNDGYDKVEENDILDTEFGHFRILKKGSSGLHVGWRDEKYLMQPTTGGWDLYAIGEDHESVKDLTHIGETSAEYARPSDSDPVFGYWLEYPDSGGEIVHIYHKSDTPAEIEAEYNEPDTIYDTQWMEDMVGGTFLVQLPDGTVVSATLYQRGDGWTFGPIDGSGSYTWHPPSSDDSDDSEVRILGIPNEGN